MIDTEFNFCFGGGGGGGGGGEKKKHERNRMPRKINPQYTFKIHDMRSLGRDPPTDKGGIK